MTSKPSLVTITYAEVAALCRRLGHDPSRVARITIEPHLVVVEYEHAVTSDPADVDVTQHMTTTTPAPDASWLKTEDVSKQSGDAPSSS